MKMATTKVVVFKILFLILFAQPFFDLTSSSSSQESQKSSVSHHHHHRHSNQSAETNDTSIPNKPTRLKNVISSSSSKEATTSSSRIRRNGPINNDNKLDDDERLVVSRTPAEEENKWPLTTTSEKDDGQAAVASKRLGDEVSRQVESALLVHDDDDERKGELAMEGDHFIGTRQQQQQQATTTSSKRSVQEEEQQNSIFTSSTTSTTSIPEITSSSDTYSSSSQSQQQQQEAEAAAELNYAELCYLSNGGSSLTLTVNEATQVGAVIGIVEVNGDPALEGGNIDLFVAPEQQQQQSSSSSSSSLSLQQSTTSTTRQRILGKRSIDDPPPTRVEPSSGSGTTTISLIDSSAAPSASKLRLISESSSLISSTNDDDEVDSTQRSSSSSESGTRKPPPPPRDGTEVGVARTRTTSPNNMDADSTTPTTAGATANLLSSSQMLGLVSDADYSSPASPSHEPQQQQTTPAGADTNTPAGQHVIVNQSSSSFYSLVSSTLTTPTPAAVLTTTPTSGHPTTTTATATNSYTAGAAVRLEPGTKNLILVRQLDKESEEPNSQGGLLVQVRCSPRRRSPAASPVPVPVPLPAPGDALNNKNQFASRQSRLQQSAATTTMIPVRIIVTDANDHAPEFVNLHQPAAGIYVVNISETAPIGSVATRDILAIDRDSAGPFSTVHYRVLEGANTDSGYDHSGAVASSSALLQFANPLDPTLLVAGQLDYETQSSFTLTILAQDEGELEPMSSSAQVQVNIIDFDDQNPRFLDDKYTLVMDETQQTLVGQNLRVLPHSLRAEDGDRGINAPIIYSFDHLGGSGGSGNSGAAMHMTSSLLANGEENPKNDLEKSPNSPNGEENYSPSHQADQQQSLINNIEHYLHLNPTSGQIRLLRQWPPSDGKLMAAHQQVAATGSASAVGAAPAPALMTLVVRATQSDNKDRYTLTTLTISQPPPSLVTSNLPASAHNNLSSSSPSLATAAAAEGRRLPTAAGAGSRGSAGGAGIQFAQEKLYVQVSESAQVNEKIAKLRARYLLPAAAADNQTLATSMTTSASKNVGQRTLAHAQNAPNSQHQLPLRPITYQILDLDNTEQTFGISASGELYLRRALDYESRKEYKFRVLATYAKYSDICQVEVSVLNENDNKPKFTQPQYTFYLTESRLRPNAIGSVLAHDADINDSLHYELIQNSSDHAHLFEVHPETGQISLKSSIKQLNISHCQLVVQVTDSLGRPPYHSHQARVNLQIAAQLIGRSINFGPSTSADTPPSSLSGRRLQNDLNSGVGDTLTAASSTVPSATLLEHHSGSGSRFSSGGGVGGGASSVSARNLITLSKSSASSSMVNNNGNGGGSSLFHTQQAPPQPVPSNQRSSVATVMSSLQHMVRSVNFLEMPMSSALLLGALLAFLICLLLIVIISMSVHFYRRRSKQRHRRHLASAAHLRHAHMTAALHQPHLGVPPMGGTGLKVATNNTTMNNNNNNNNGGVVSTIVGQQQQVAPASSVAGCYLPGGVAGYAQPGLVVAQYSTNGAQHSAMNAGAAAAGDKNNKTKILNAGGKRGGKINQVHAHQSSSPLLISSPSSCSNSSPTNSTGVAGNSSPPSSGSSSSSPSSNQMGNGKNQQQQQEQLMAAATGGGGGIPFSKLTARVSPAAAESKNKHHHHQRTASLAALPHLMTSENKQTLRTSSRQSQVSSLLNSLLLVTNPTTTSRADQQQLNGAEDPSCAHLIAARANILASQQRGEKSSSSAASHAHPPTTGAALREVDSLVSSLSSPINSSKRSYQSSNLSSTEDSSVMHCGHYSVNPATTAGGGSVTSPAPPLSPPDNHNKQPLTNNNKYKQQQRSTAIEAAIKSLVREEEEERASRADVDENKATNNNNNIYRSNHEFSPDCDRHTLSPGRLPEIKSYRKLPLNSLVRTAKIPQQQHQQQDSAIASDASSSGASSSRRRGSGAGGGDDMVESSSAQQQEVEKEVGALRALISDPEHRRRVSTLENFQFTTGTGFMTDSMATPRREQQKQQVAFSSDTHSSATKLQDGGMKSSAGGGGISWPKGSAPNRVKKLTWDDELSCMSRSSGQGGNPDVATPTPVFGAGMAASGDSAGEQEDCFIAPEMRSRLNATGTSHPPPQGNRVGIFRYQASGGALLEPARSGSCLSQLSSSNHQYILSDEDDDDVANCVITDQEEEEDQHRLGHQQYGDTHNRQYHHHQYDEQHFLFSNPCSPGPPSGRGARDSFATPTFSGNAQIHSPEQQHPPPTTTTTNPHPHQDRLIGGGGGVTTTGTGEQAAGDFASIGLGHASNQNNCFDYTIVQNCQFHVDAFASRSPMSSSNGQQQQQPMVGAEHNSESRKRNFTAAAAGAALPESSTSSNQQKQQQQTTSYMYSNKPLSNGRQLVFGGDRNDDHNRVFANSNSSSSSTSAQQQQRNNQNHQNEDLNNNNNKRILFHHQQQQAHQKLITSAAI